MKKARIEPFHETLLGQSNISDLGTIGDRLYDEKFYEPAKIIYEHLDRKSVV